MIDKDYFRREYDLDESNKAKQRYEEYEKWVDYFYSNHIWDGWDKLSGKLLARFSGLGKNNIKEKLEKLGKKICAEWAKDNSVRVIENNDLSRFFNELEGPGITENAIRNILKEVEHRLSQKIHTPAK